MHVSSHVLRPAAAPPAPPAAPAPATSPAPTADDRVVIVGAGPAGMATAIELAQHGVPSVVLEKRGMEGTRAPVFAVVPPFADRLAALDEGTGELTKLLAPLDDMYSTTPATGRERHRTFDPGMQPDATRSRGDMQALLRAAGSDAAEGADTRRWSIVGIDTIENGLRSLATTRYADLIDIRTDSGVTELRNGDGWAEAVLGPTADGAARDAVRGAMLIDASGRDLLGSDRTTYPEQTNWIGARFPATAPDASRASVRLYEQDSAGRPEMTVSLPGADRSIVWKQVHEDPKQIDPATARELITKNAPLVGVDTKLADDAPIMPVNVQLWTTKEPARGRILKVGDSVRAPYFMTSTGAATALVHDAPRAVDAVLAVRGGAPVADAVGAFSDAMLGANEALVDLVRPAHAIHSGAAPIPYKS